MDGICIGLILPVILIINTLPFVVSEPGGFISIDCGATQDYYDNKTQIQWRNDTLYSEIGESYSLPQEKSAHRELLTVRSFPKYKKNCYEIPTTNNTKYLLRLRFFYANFDHKSSGPERSMYLIIDDVIIQRINPLEGTVTEGTVSEFILTAVSNVTSVCFGRVYGDPFVNSIELRELHPAMYPLATRDTILSIVHQNALQYQDSAYFASVIRHPNDTYDRFWVPSGPSKDAGYFPDQPNETSENPKCSEKTRDEVPDAVMKNGVKSNSEIEADGNIDGKEISLTLFFANQGNRSMEIYSTLHYTTLNGQSLTYVNSTEISPGDCAFSTIQNDYTNRKTPYHLGVWTELTEPSNRAGSQAGGARGYSPKEPSPPPSPPSILNAWHVSSLHYRSEKPTNPTDFDIMRRIRVHFNITKWTGDPCLPRGFTWEKVECDYDGSKTTVKSVDLSGMKLHNTVPDLFTNLTSLNNLDLSNNDLYGKLPDSLFKTHFLKVDYSNNPKLPQKFRLTTADRNILIGIVVPVGVIALFVGFLVCRHIRGLTLEIYTRDTKETQVPWSSPVVKKGPSHDYHKKCLQLDTVWNWLFKFFNFIKNIVQA